MRLTTRCLLVGVVLLLAPWLASAQLLTGTITGTVADNSGGIMPGVTVTVGGEHLIGGPRSAVTNDRGEYRFDNLPPGAYNVKFELAGFKTVERQEVAVSAGFVATINVALEIGSVEETITVMGASPTVDTKSNVQQVVMSQKILEGIPSGRDVWSLGKIIPGVQVSTYDVGGTQGMQQSTMTAHGSDGDDKTFAIDGLSVNWSGTGGGATMVYYDQGMFEEVNYQTSAIPAEVAIGGIYMNMVTKAGGNTWSGDTRYYWANDSTQSANFADVSAKYNFPGGNPITKQYDLNATGAGPILKDRLWFFGSFRRWRVDKKLLSVYNSDGTNAIDDNLISNGSSKLTFNASPKHRLSAVYNFNQKNRYHRRDTPPYFVDDKASYLQLQPGYTGNVKYSWIVTNNSFFESTFGGVSGVWPLHYQPDVLPTDLYHEDSALSTAWGAAPRTYENPNYRAEFDNVFSHTQTGWAGNHNFKAGVQFTRQMYRDVNRANGDIRLYYNNGVPYRVTLLNTPVIATNYTQQLGIFGQDSWSIGNLTLNLGARWDRLTGWIPAQTSPAGTYAPARSIQQMDVYKQTRPVWRAGAVYDLSGSGRTAIKGNWSRYAHQVGTAYMINDVNPFAISTANIAWNDVNHDGLPQPNELGKFEGFVGGASTRYGSPDGAAWAYADEITSGIEHELMKDLRVAVMYYHRTNRDMVGSVNAAVPSSAYTPVTIANPLGGTVTFYNLNPAYLGKQDNVKENIPLLDNDYNGIEITASKRFSNRWQMLFGFTGGKQTGGLLLPSRPGDFNDPNNLINQQGVAGDDSTYQFKLSGSYQIPRAEITVAANLLHNTGYPRQFTYTITRAIYPQLTRSSQTIALNSRGDYRLPSVFMADLRFSRPFRLGGNLTFEPQIDIFNITNNDVIVTMVNAVGPRLGYPSEILAPRLIRFGFLVKF